jgi:acetyl/propionyl-CoA carboxylase alpha subunit
MIRTVLIGNRGEIARRVMRTCRRLGIRTVAVYSDADGDAPHVRDADEAVRIGEAPVASSYLRQDRLIEAARSTGADAIHPGYGLLSEKSEFAQAVIDAGLTWIGPPPAAMAAMGSKLGARALAERLDIPLLPASWAVDPRDEAGLLAQGDAVGYPLLVKLSGGGGGIGMARVDGPAKLLKAVEKARRRGESSFADATAYLERAIDGARHIEVQVLADKHGNVVHLGERDCSTQRRHQKVIEEAPAPGLSDEDRARLGAAAVRLARAVGYESAGTVEFLWCPDGSFALLEMNTRIQVEHPVTEMVTGLDLVELQLRVAEGLALPFGQSDHRVVGHAIEMRIYAEDPVAFLPRPGTVTAFAAPEGEGLRCDHAMRDGIEITPFYDPLIAKLIAHGHTREEARARALAALSALRVEGIVHNAPLLREVLDSAAFAEGRVHTGLIDALRGGG